MQQMGIFQPLDCLNVLHTACHSWNKYSKHCRLTLSSALYPRLHYTPHNTRTSAAMPHLGVARNIPHFCFWRPDPIPARNVKLCNWCYSKWKVSQRKKWKDQPQKPLIFSYTTDVGIKVKSSSFVRQCLESCERLRRKNRNVRQSKRLIISCNEFF